MKWQDISSAPKDGTWFLAFRPFHKGGYSIDVVRWREADHDPHVRLPAGFGGDEWMYPDRFNFPTHWQPLPEPPNT